MTQRFQNILLNAVSTTGAGTALSGDDRETSSAVFDVTITGSATITFQGKGPGGNTYSIPVTSVAASPATATTVTSSGTYRCDATGISVFPNVTTYASGTVTVTGSLVKGTLSGGVSSGGGGTTAATIADGADVAEGSKADAAVTNPTLSASVIAALKGIIATLQATPTAAVPVVLQNAGLTGTTPLGDSSADAIYVNPAKGSLTAVAVSALATSTLLLAANTARKSCIIVNNGTTTVYLGVSSAVATASGIPLAAGQSFSDSTSTSAWYGISATGTNDVRVGEIA